MEKTADILWKSCANGNNESFKSLFDTWYEPLCRYSCFFTGDSMDAEEVVLDFFMYIWHNRATIVIEKSFEAYAKTAVHNRSLNKIRSRKHHEELDKASSVSFEETYEFDTDTLIDIAWEAASSAPKRCREIFNNEPERWPYICPDSLQDRSGCQDRRGLYDQGIEIYAYRDKKNSSFFDFCLRVSYGFDVSVN